VVECQDYRHARQDLYPYLKLTAARYAPSGKFSDGKSEKGRRRATTSGFYVKYQRRV
jgi:hypothetical protein